MEFFAGIRHFLSHHTLIAILTDSSQANEDTSHSTYNWMMKNFYLQLSMSLMTEMVCAFLKSSMLYLVHTLHSGVDKQEK